MQQLIAMTRTSITHPLDDFLRDAKSVAKRMKRTRQPEFLTVDATHEIVLLDAGMYQRLLEIAELSGAVAGIRRGIRDVDEGRHMSLTEFDARIRRKHKMPKRA